MKSPAHLANRPAFFITPGTSRPRVAIRCSRCTETEIGSDKPGAPPPLISRHFAEKGWKVYREGASATCPTCQEAGSSETTEPDDGAASLARQREAEERRQAALLPMPTERLIASLPPSSEPKPIMTTPSASQNAYRAQAIMHRLLGEHFTAEGETGTYDEGWSDARISNEAGLALAEVTRVREAAYGKILDPRFARIDAAIAAASAKLARDTAELATLLETVKAEGAKAIADLRRQLAEIRGRS